MDQCNGWTLTQLDCLHKLCWISPLHLDHFIVAGPIIKRVAPLGKVVQYIVSVQRRDSSTVKPRRGQELVITGQRLRTGHDWSRRSFTIIPRARTLGVPGIRVRVLCPDKLWPLNCDMSKGLSPRHNFSLALAAKSKKKKSQKFIHDAQLGAGLKYD